MITLFRYANDKTPGLKDVDIDDLITISDYYETDRYPGPKYTQPSRNEVEDFFLLAEHLYHTIYKTIK
ncbi:HEPN domain-containing protein [Roseimarinus sediminis]|uniref:hypothetical protein n=1 Tax=Roseimarinus sediminis TaxID=1610899 RepID=UPI003D261802